MDLILWRHAEAHDPREGQSDLDRALTPRGEKQAARMAAWLDRQLPDGARVLVSPARRTEQTVKALGRRYKLCPELVPGCTPAALLALAGWPDARAPVLIVGHQPTMGMTAALLMGGLQDSAEAGDAQADHATPAWSVRKGAVWWLRHRERSGVAEVVLVSVRSPDSL